MEVPSAVIPVEQSGHSVEGFGASQRKQALKGCSAEQDGPECIRGCSKTSVEGPGQEVPKTPSQQLLEASSSQAGGSGIRSPFESYQEAVHGDYLPRLSKSLPYLAVRDVRGMQANPSIESWRNPSGTSASLAIGRPPELPGPDPDPPSFMRGSWSSVKV